jgi:hypothetical protein
MNRLSRFAQLAGPRLGCRAMSSFLERIKGELSAIEEAGTWKKERIIASTQVCIIN